MFAWPLTPCSLAAGPVWVTGGAGQAPKAPAVLVAGAEMEGDAVQDLAGSGGPEEPPSSSRELDP